MINFLLCQVRLILFNTNLITKSNIRENRSEEVLNHHELCEIAMRT